MARLHLLIVSVLATACSLLPSTCQAGAYNQTVDPTQIKKVHLVFMNHLDVGYDGIYPTIGFAVNVINKYFTIYYPRAVSISFALRLFGYQERLVYTTHPWLLYMYLHCVEFPFKLSSNVTLQCPNSSDVDSMKYTISVGDVSWHAGPMNMEFEAMHPDMLDLSLTFSEMLDQEFNITREAPVVSQRDVPGLTQAVIPIFKKHKIAAVSVGVNVMTSPPAVPRTPFIWKLNADDKDEDGIIAFWHPGGYPNNPGVYPARPGGMSVNDCLFAKDVAAFPETLCFVFRTDNSGPPETVNEVLDNFEIARAQFPNGQIVASTLDNYVSALKQSKTSYPVVTQEIGDTWIMGIQSDPFKVAAYRAFSRVMSDCFRAGKCSMSDPRLVQSVFYLTKLPEHTWGLDSVNDFKNWTNEEFQKARSDIKYTNCEASWSEQRDFIPLAYESLGSHPVTGALQAAGLELVPKLPDLSAYTTVTPTDQQTCKDGTVLQFGSDGSLIRLYDPYSQTEWASESAPLAQVLYRTYNETDYDYMSKLYDYVPGGAGFHKVNSTQYAHPESRQWPFKLIQLFRRKGDSECDFIIVTGPENSEAYSKYGAPPMFYIQFKTANSSVTSKRGLDIVLQWFSKGPTRLSEAIYFGFTPSIPGYQWLMSKLGSLVDPTNVILNGSQWIHAINEGVYYKSPNGAGLEILSEDVALLVVGTDSHPPSVNPVPLTPINEPIKTVAFNLYNNFWNTNYIYWYPYRQMPDQDFKARFSLLFA